MNIPEAAQALVEKINTKGERFDWYKHGYYELINALKNPLLPPTFQGQPVEGAEDEDAVCFYARTLVFEISQLADEPHYELSEYKTLLALLEAEGLQCDASKMTEAEYLDSLIAGGAEMCPPELSDKLLALLKHKARPN